MEPPQTEYIYVKTETYSTGTEYTLNGGGHFGRALRTASQRTIGLVSFTKSINN